MFTANEEIRINNEVSKRQAKGGDFNEAIDYAVRQYKYEAKDAAESRRSLDRRNGTGYADGRIVELNHEVEIYEEIRHRLQNAQ